MNIFRAYKFRLYPNEKQKEMIHKTFGCTRLVYNHFLDIRQKEYKNTSKNKSPYKCLKELTDLKREYVFFKEVDSQSMQAVIFDLDNAYTRFFNGAGFPKFICKGWHDSYKINNVKNEYKGRHYENIRLDLKNRIITLPKLKQVKIKGYRNEKYIIGDIKSATISRETNKYFVSVLVEEPFFRKPITPKSIVEIDLGIKDMIVMSYNEKIQNTVKVNEKRLKGLSRCQKGSKNRYKLKLKIQRLYLKIKNSRKHLIHNITNKLLKDNDIIVCENLDIKNMYEKHSIAKCLNQIPLGEIINTLKYKAQWQGKQVIQIDRYYPSSQVCSVCDYKNEKVKDLNVRKWECPKCHTYHNRDVNASVNIMFEELKNIWKA